MWGRLFVPFRAAGLRRPARTQAKRPSLAGTPGVRAPRRRPRGAGVGGTGEARGGATRCRHARSGPRAGRRRAPWVQSQCGGGGGIADLGRPPSPGRCRSRGPPGTPRAGGRCPGRWDVGVGRPGAAARWLGWVSHRTLFGVSCGFFPAPPRKPGTGAGVHHWEARCLLGSSPLLLRAGREGGRMRRQGKPLAGIRSL